MEVCIGSRGVNFVLYQPIWAKFIILAGQPILKYLCFIPFKILDYIEYTSDYRTYRLENKNRPVQNIEKKKERKILKIS